MKTKKDKSKIKKDFKINLHHNHKINMEIDYFVAGLEMEANEAIGAKKTKILHNDYNDVLTGIRCFKDTSSVQIKDNVKPFHIPPRHAAYPLEEPFTYELERL